MDSVIFRWGVVIGVCLAKLRQVGEVVVISRCADKDTFLFSPFSIAVVGRFNKPVFCVVWCTFLLSWRLLDLFCERSRDGRWPLTCFRWPVLSQAETGRLRGMTAFVSFVSFISPSILTLPFKVKIEQNMSFFSISLIVKTIVKHYFSLLQFITSPYDIVRHTEGNRAQATCIPLALLADSGHRYGRYLSIRDLPFSSSQERNRRCLYPNWARTIAVVITNPSLYLPCGACASIY